MRTLLALAVLTLAPQLARAESDAGDAADKPSTVHKEDEEEAEPLWEAELRFGYGVMSRGTEMGAHTTKSPVSIEASGAIAVNEEPYVMAYGGLVGEVIERTAVGVTAGARVKIPELPLRVGGGGTWMFAPKTLWGAQAGVGGCVGHGSIGWCADVQMTAFFAGSGLPNDETELQVQLVLGLVARGARE